ncbi:MAG TPA: histidine kinase dimerization/phospho-acceptor domain-containing protein [Lysobacter sp.]|nr:histidine kinase dimerization/phospho-acceptor domain-containing protein [Lysobacter sp.]
MPLPLRARVTLLYTLMGLVLSVLFASATVFISEEYERVLLETILSSQVEDYATRLTRQPDLDLPQTSRLSAYLRRPDGSGEVPAELASQPPGIRELPEDQDGVHLAVADTAAGRLFFTIDLHDVEELERYLAFILLAVVVLGTLASAWLGWLMSGGVVRPVRRLADAVGSLPTQPVATHLGRGLPADELGRLGTAIDEYQARLVSAEETERAFFADASHELRTPISVVRGATELLLEDSDELPALRPRLLRLDRGIRELSELIDALLRLARRRTSAPERVALHGWLTACLANADPVRNGQVRLVVDGGERDDRNEFQPAEAGRDDDPGPDGDCLLPVAEAELVLRGIVRRMLPPGVPGQLRVTGARQPGSCHTVELHFTSPDTLQTSAAKIQPRPSDRRLGLTLVGRLAEQLGWRIDDTQAESGRVVIQLPHGEPVRESGASGPALA